MMVSPIVVTRLFQGAPRLALLDPAQGRIVDEDIPAMKSHGNFFQLENNLFALYASRGVLNFQWNELLWPLHLIAPKIYYRHDLAKQTTIFGIEDKEIEYPAWWRGDPHFEPALPERDEDEDYLGYIAAMSQDLNRQYKLLEAWRT